MRYNVELTGAARLIAQRPATEGSEVERRVSGHCCHPESDA